jgi:uncharacterized BrkB/YihY/UPF0761 family membrane protein
MAIDSYSFVTALSAIITGSVGVWFSTEMVKKVQAFKLNEGHKIRIRAVALVISALLTAVVAWTSDSLRPENIQDVLVAVLAAMSLWGGAHSIHEVTKQ